MKHRLMRFALRLLALAVLLVGAGFSGSFWLLKTEAGLQFLLKQSSSLLGSQLDQRLRFKGAQGTIWDGVELDSLDWTDGKTQLALQKVLLRMDLGRLWYNEAVVTNLSADVVRINLPEPSSSQDEPSEMPASIHLPVSISLEKLEVQKLIVAGQELNQIVGSATVQDGRFNLSRLELNAQGTNVGLKGQMRLDRPFELGLNLDLSKRIEQILELKAQAHMTGSLDELFINLDAQGSGLEKAEAEQALTAIATVTPFKKTIVRSVTAKATGFNPAMWFTHAPNGKLTLKAEVVPNADFTHSAGSLEVSNAKPESLQSKGLPFSKLVATFDLNLDGDLPTAANLDVSNLTLADEKGRAGVVAAKMSWAQAKGKGRNDVERAGDFELKLDASDLRLSALTDQHLGALLNLKLDARKKGSIVQVDHLQASDRGASFVASGQSELLGMMLSDLKLQIRKVNPANYSTGNTASVKGSVNADLSWKGTLGTEGYGGQLKPRGEVDLEMFDSVLANAPLQGNLKARGDLQRLDQFKLYLGVLGNRLDAAGAYGQQGDAMRVDLNANNLPALGKLLGLDLRGTAVVKGQFAGVAPAISGQLDVDVQGLKVAKALSLESAKGNFEVGLQADSAWQGDLKISALKVSGQDENLIRKMSLVLTGTRSSHKAVLDFESDRKPFSRRRAVGGRLVLQGGLKNLLKNDQPPAWSGNLTELKLEGLWRPVRSLTLSKPMPVQLASGSVELGQLVLAAEDESSIVSEKLVFKEGRLELVGHAPRLTLPRIGSLVKQEVTLETKDLVTDLKWRLISSRDKFDGHVNISYVSGGLAILEDAEVEVPLNTFSASVDVSRQAIKAEANIDARSFGVVTAGVSLPVIKDVENGGWMVAADQAMTGAVAAGISDLSWLGPLLNPALRTSGDGQLAVALGGTLNNPTLDGRLFAREMNLTQLDQGIRLEDGNVVVDFTNDHARIDTFDFTVYHRQAPARRIEELGPLIQGTGKVSATGQWNLNGLNGGLDLKMNRVGLIQRPDRWLMTDADISVRQPVRDGDPIKVRGLVTALGAYIELPETEPQTLGSDVVIRGQAEDSAGGAPIDVEIRAVLGDLFFLNADGLKTRLAGGMNLVVQDGVRTATGTTGRRLEARGTIQAVDGTYRAYGQDLTIERGVVNFQGPMNNPGLNIRAVRKGVAVEAGVEITGSANRPQITLVSDPPVPDAEKLSWMIIGRGSNSSDRDTTVLLTAAAAIFGDDDDSTTRKIAKSLGIDDFALSSGSLTAADSRAVGSQVAISPGADPSAAILGADDPLLTQRLITLGKRLNGKLYLNFEQSVTTAASVLKLTYQYSRRLSFIARGGADNAVDALYQFSFD